MSNGPSNDDACPTIGQFIRCLVDNHVCRREQVPIFRGDENEDGPLLTRLVGPSGFIPDISIFPDDEPATPSTIDYFCRRLGVDRTKVHIDGPSGRIRVDVVSERVLPEVPATITPITSAAGHSRRRARQKR